MSKYQLEFVCKYGRMLAWGLAAIVLAVATIRAALPEGRNVDIDIDNGDVRLSLPGIQDATYDIQVKSALSGTWGALDTVIGQDGLTVYTLSPDDSPTRFFRVLFPQPTVTAGEPAFVPDEGGTTVYVTGQYFYEGDQIYVGGVLLDDVTFISSTLLSGTLPALAPGLHAVAVVSGSSGAVLASLPGAIEVSPPLGRTLQGPPEWPPAGPSPALLCGGGNIKDIYPPGPRHALSSQEDGHVTVLKSRGGGHVTVLKSHEGGEDNDCDGTDDIRLFAGEVRQQVTDLAVPGRGLDFVWTRTYRSRTGTATPQGSRWSHSYDVRCVQNGTAIDIYDGTGRKDTFRLQSNGTYTCPELFREGTLDADTGTFRLTFADTGYWEFNPFGASPAAGKLANIVDRNGNTMTLDYDGAGRLTAVVDDLDRTNSVAYTPAGQLMSVTDFSGRTVLYEYDGVGNLTACVSPAVTGTSTGNDFPGGKTNRYVYSSGYADDRENHLLLSVIDAEGQTSHQYVYQHNQTDADFLRCTSLQRWTNTPTRVTYLPQTPMPGNRFASLRCIVNDPEGNVSEHDFDVRNRCVALREHTGRATPGQPVTEASNRPAGKLRPDDPDVFESSWSWNNDGLCTRWQRPLTNRVEWVYQADLDPATPPRHRGNLREERRVANGDLDGDGMADVAVSRFEHDPRFGSDPAGPTLGAIVPAIGEVCDGGRFCQSFVIRVINPRGFETRCDYDTHGNLVTLTRHDSSDGSDTPPVLAREDFAYNADGQLTTITNAEDGEGRRRVDTFSYHSNGPQRGYLQQAVADAGPAGRNLTTTFEYDARGNLTRRVDPRGTPTEFEVNALNQRIGRQTQGSSFGERVRAEFHYDAANNLVRMDVENRDGDGTLNPTNAWFTTRYEYDPLHRLTRLRRPKEEESTGQEQEQQVLTHEYVYDGNDRLVLERSPQAVQGGDPFHVMQTAYDERGLLFRETSAPGSPLQATTQYDYDGNGNLRATRSGLEAADGPRVTEYAYDGLDRRTRVTDPMGNETRFEYDLNDNLVRQTVYGETNDVPGSAGNRRLTETRYEYDALDRLVRFRPAFFDVFTQLPIGDGFQDNTSTYAPNGLVVATTNDRGHGTAYTFDTTMFLTSVADAGSNRVDYTYDANGNVLSATQTGHSDLGGPDEVFVGRYAYDAIDRCVADWDNVGNTNRYAYDSRGNLVRHIDPLGFSLEGDFDGISRPTSNRKGIGGGAQTSTRSVWDAASRLAASTDGNTNTTTYAYDSLDRVIRTTLADGTSVTNIYDVHGNLAWTRDANGTEIAYVYDALDRCVQKSITPGPGIAADTTVELYQYDGLSRLVRAQNNHTEVTRAYDSLGRCVGEGTASPTLGFNPREYTRTFDAHGLALAQTYPSGRRVEYSYDALDRPVSLAWRVSAGAPFQSLGTLAYAGPDRLARVTRANGVQTDYTYSGLAGVANSPGDFGWGQIQGVRHALDGAPAIAAFTFAHDRNQNKTLRALTEPFVPGGPTNLQTFAYDSLDRLVHAVTATNGATARDTTYALDPMGNRLSVIRDGADQLYTLDPALPTPGDFQVHQYTDTPFDARQYDENGNLHQTVAGDPADPEVRTFSYDYADRLVAVQDADGPVAQYAYDALGRRIAKVRYAGLPPVPVSTNRYLYAGGQVIEEEDGRGAVARTYVLPHVFDQKGRAGQSFVLDGTRSQDDGAIRGGRVMINGEDQVTYVLGDDQGSAMAVTDAKGQVVERYDYDDFGAPSFLDADGNPRPGATASLTGVPQLFHGMEWDEETGLFWGGNHLDPNTGSTLSRTHSFPHVFDQKGRAYAGNNPWSAPEHGIGGAAFSTYTPDEMLVVLGLRGARPEPFHNKYSALRTTDVTGEIFLMDGRSLAILEPENASRAKGTVKFFNEAKGFGRTGGGGTKAQDHNSSRSHGCGGSTRAQDHNSSRSNKTASRVDFGGGGGGAGKVNCSFQFFGPGSEPFTGSPAAFIVPVAINKGLRFTARTGRNPQTGKEIKIAAKKVAKFKAGKALADTVK